MSFIYDVVISFAGEQRPLADAINTRLKNAGIKTFYDDDHKAELWGENLSVKLQDVYSKQGLYCLMLVSDHYLQKIWTRHERKSAITRMLKQEKAYILPYLIDANTLNIPGLPDDTAFLSSTIIDPEELCDVLIKKIQKEHSGNKRLQRNRIHFAVLDYLMKTHNVAINDYKTGEMPIVSCIRDYVREYVGDTLFSAKTFAFHFNNMIAAGTIEVFYQSIAGDHYQLTEDGIEKHHELRSLQ